MDPQDPDPALRDDPVTFDPDRFSAANFAEIDRWHFIPFGAKPGRVSAVTQQNVDMRKISAWAALAAIPTTVSGIYGMRFVNIPEEHWVWSYPTVIAALVLTTVVLYRAFRRKGWL